MREPAAEGCAGDGVRVDGVGVNGSVRDLVRAGASQSRVAQDLVAGVHIRAAISNGLLHNQKHRIWTWGPAFRYEKKGVVYVDGDWRNIQSDRKAILCQKLFTFPESVLATAITYSGKGAKWLPVDPATVKAEEKAEETAQDAPADAESAGGNGKDGDGGDGGAAGGAGVGRMEGGCFSGGGNRGDDRGQYAG